jgi:hypothetical protein
VRTCREICSQNPVSRQKLASTEILSAARQLTKAPPRHGWRGLLSARPRRALSPAWRRAREAAACRVVPTTPPSPRAFRPTAACPRRYRRALPHAGWLTPGTVARARVAPRAWCPAGSLFSPFAGRVRRGLFTNGLGRGRNTLARRLRGARHLLLWTALLSALCQGGGSGTEATRGPLSAPSLGEVRLGSTSKKGLYVASPRPLLASHGADQHFDAPVGLPAPLGGLRALQP